MSNRSRRRVPSAQVGPQVVRTRSGPFLYSAFDSPRDTFGAGESPKDSRRELPRAQFVRRFIDAARSAAISDLLDAGSDSRVWGGQPHASLRRRGRSAVRGVVGPQFGPQIRPLQALVASRARAAASWREFQKLRVASPRTDSLCVRRRKRREVLFSLRVAGRRGSAPGARGTYRRTLSSQWSC